MYTYAAQIGEERERERERDRRTRTHVSTMKIEVISIGQWKKNNRTRTGKRKCQDDEKKRRNRFSGWTYIAGWRTFALHCCMRKRISDQIIIIIIGIIINSSCGDNSHCLLLLNKFIGIQENVGSHQTSEYRTNQLFGLNLYRYGMCTRRFGVCVHSCEQVSGIDGEERNLSPFLSFSLPFSNGDEREGEKEFEILSPPLFSLPLLSSFAHIHIARAVALLPIYLLSTVHRPMKFQNRRVKRAEKTTTATTIEREREREREKERRGETEKRMKKEKKWRRGETDP